MTRTFLIRVALGATLALGAWGCEDDDGPKPTTDGASDSRPATRRRHRHRRHRGGPHRGRRRSGRRRCRRRRSGADHAAGARQVPGRRGHRLSRVPHPAGRDGEVPARQVPVGRQRHQQPGSELSVPQHAGDGVHLPAQPDQRRDRPEEPHRRRDQEDDHGGQAPGGHGGRHGRGPAPDHAVLRAEEHDRRGRRRDRGVPADGAAGGEHGAPAGRLVRPPDAGAADQHGQRAHAIGGLRRRGGGDPRPLPGHADRSVRRVPHQAPDGPDRAGRDQVLPGRRGLHRPPGADDPDQGEEPHPGHDDRSGQLDDRADRRRAEGRQGQGRQGHLPAHAGGQAGRDHDGRLRQSDRPGRQRHRPLPQVHPGGG